MHIEPGIVEGSKILLSYGTAATMLGWAVMVTGRTVKRDGIVSLMSRSVLTTLLVFCFFEVLPHYPIGVSEVHLILGTTLFLLFGLAPAAIGLAVGLLLQGMFFAPFDLPQYGINITTLLAPLFAVNLLARKVIPRQTPYVDLTYSQVFKLSLAYQGGIVAWVAFWAFFGQGFGAENLSNVGSFAVAYLCVVLIEPLIDLAVLAGAKSLRTMKNTLPVEKRLYSGAYDA